MKKQKTRKAGEGYNGWANRPTWNLALWVMNTESMYISMQEAFCGETRVKPTDAALWAGKIFPTGSTPDGDSLRDVEWSEIASMIEGAVND